MESNARVLCEGVLSYKGVLSTYRVVSSDESIGVERFGEDLCGVSRWAFLTDPFEALTVLHNAVAALDDSLQEARSVAVQAGTRLVRARKGAFPSPSAFLQRAVAEALARPKQHPKPKPKPKPKSKARK